MLLRSGCLRDVTMDKNHLEFPRDAYEVSYVSALWFLDA